METLQNGDNQNGDSQKGDNQNGDRTYAITETQFFRSKSERRQSQVHFNIGLHIVDLFKLKQRNKLTVYINKVKNNKCNNVQ